MNEPVVLVIDWLGRPHTSNAERRLPWYKVGPIHAEWREAGAMAALMAKLGPMPPCVVTIQARYRHNKLTDVGAVAPSAKCAIDGLVDRGVWPDDTSTHVRGENYLPPIHEPSLPDALILTLTPETP